MKNNLQVIVSFLALQRRQSSGEEARERIARVMDRVLAIGLAHDQLSFKDSASTSTMHDYLKALCANIDPRRPQISIEVDVDAASMPLDRAVPVGLIVNELVTNSVKYAFDDEGGIISVVFRVNETSAKPSCRCATMAAAWADAPRVVRLAAGGKPCGPARRAAHHRATCRRER